MDYLVILLLCLLFFYLLILKGLPWVASKYASYRFGAHVGVKTIDFISRSLRDVTFRTKLSLNNKKENEVSVSLGIDEVLISTNFFSDVYSTLIVVKLNGVRLTVNVDSLSTSTLVNEHQNTQESQQYSNADDDDSVEPANKHLQKFVEYVSYLKFLVTFVARDVNLRIDTKDDQDPISAASFEASGIKILPESMRNGLVNLSINLEESVAEVCDGNNRKAKLCIAKANTNTIIHVFPPEIDTVEFKSVCTSDESGIILIIPLSFAATYFNWKKRQEKHSSRSETKIKHSRGSKVIQVLPNLSVNLTRLQVQIVDDEICSPKVSRPLSCLISNLNEIDLNFDKTDMLLAIDIGAYSLESKGNTSLSKVDQRYRIIDIRTAKARKSPSILSASWNLCHIRCDLYQANSILTIFYKLMAYSKRKVRFDDTFEELTSTAYDNTKHYLSKSLLQVTVVQGTFDQPSCEMIVVQMQCLSAILGDSGEYDDDYYMESSTFNRQGSSLNSIDIEAFHCSVDYEQEEVYLTTTQINTSLSQAPLKVAFKWVRFIMDVKHNSSSLAQSFMTTQTRLPKERKNVTKWNKTNFRAGNANVTFRLSNGIEVKFATGAIKLKRKLSLLKDETSSASQSASCKDISLSMWSLTGEGSGSTGTPRAMLRRVLTIPYIIILRGQVDIGTQITFNDKIKIHWSTLIHKVFFDVLSIIKEEAGNLKLDQNDYRKDEKSDSNKGGNLESKLHVKFDHGLDLSTKLQNQTINIGCYKTLTFSRYTSEDWKLNAPRVTINVEGLTQPGDLIRFDDILVIRTTGAHQLAKQYRSEIDNIEQEVNPKSIIISMGLCEIAFPHQTNVHNLFSNEFLGVYKWLKMLHNESDTDWEKIHPDILIFLKQVCVEFQDDPFEVQLRDNFELLEDEFKESKKREKCLNNRIDELKRTHFMLPSLKIEELFNSLKKKNADIYVQRAKSLKSNINKRTRLLSLNLSSMELCMFSDKSMTGKEKIMRFIHSVDSESPWIEDLDFVSAFYKWLRFECRKASIMLRDFPQSFAEANNVILWGRAVFADQLPMERATREQIIDQGKPYYHNFVLKRSLMSYKLYHDIAMDMKYAAFAHGPCWEATLAQFSITLNYVTGQSQDPSPRLAWWDKYRYLFHGRFLCHISTLKLLLHTTLDPYNTTEEVELSLNDATIDWTNDGLLTCRANLDLYVRTASKYDDCHLLHVPNLVLTFKFDWLCIGNPKDHHSVMLCSKEKVPEYYGHREGHDSWRSFRSKNVNLRLTLETKASSGQKYSVGSETLTGHHRLSSSTHDRARLEMFSSTLRWLESLKWLFSGASRPIRRGNLFSNPQDPKQSFFRHFRNINCSCSLYQMQIDYWTSASKTKGVLVNIAQGLIMSSEYSLKLVRPNDGLIHRPRSEWTIEFTNCQLGTSDIWIQSMTDTTSNGSNQDDNNEDQPIPYTIGSGRQIEKSFFFSVEDVQYKYSRENTSFLQRTPSFYDKSTKHILIVNGAKGAWTESNRDMAYALYDSWRRALILRGQVSGEGIKVALAPSGQQSSSPSGDNDAYERNTKLQKFDSSDSLTNVENENDEGLSFSSLNKEWNGSVQKLIELAGKGGGGGCVPIVYSEDYDSSVTEKKKEMGAMRAIQKDDIVCTNWSISFINSQVLLKGIETRGHLIMSAAKAHVEHNLHKPVWINDGVFSKSSWVGSLESMQYFATVLPETDDITESGFKAAEQILWLSRDKIEDSMQESSLHKSVRTRAEKLPELVGSGESAGGVVSQVVGGVGAMGTSMDGIEFMHSQLQRIVSKCKCEVAYVSYGDEIVGSQEMPKQSNESPWSTKADDPLVNSFSLMHHDLNVCTNSLQYSMILDVLNNLLLYIEPTMKSRSEKFLRMKYQLMLSNLEDQRKPMVHLQSQIRQLSCHLRQTERDIFDLENPVSNENVLESGVVDMPTFEGEINEGTEGYLTERYDRLVSEFQQVKEELNVKSEELDLRVRCFQEFQLSTNQKQKTTFTNLGDSKSELRRKNEIFFSRAKWKLTETDGQLGIADVTISNFFYNKNNMKDDSAEHLLEIGSLHVKNLLPDQLYEDVIYPTDLPKDVPLDRHRTLRVFCRERAPVGGISVKAHFEINLVPITIGMTYGFYKKIMAFCFPEKASNMALAQDEEYFRANNGNKKDKKKKGKKKEKSDKNQTAFYVQSPLATDDIEEMKTRAQKNKLFVYIKIPEVPIRVSYKGERDKKHITDISNFLLQFPTIEYHNVTWTWLDFANAVKKQTKDSLAFQAVKQKLNIRSNVTGHHSLLAVNRIGGGSTMSLNSSISSNSNFTTIATETGSTASGDRVFDKEDEVKAELLLGTNKLMPKRGKK